MPAKAVDLCAQWIVHYNVHIQITRSRASKLGDYMPLHKQVRNHIITINHDLNRFAFLITLVHEFAHLTTFNNHGHRVQPHGLEWKNQFAMLMQNFLGQNIFPPDVEAALKAYMINPAASSCTDITLNRALKKHNANNVISFLEELPDGSLFKLHKSMPHAVFKKGNKLRKCFECIEIKSGRMYRVNSIAEVLPMTG